VGKKHRRRERLEGTAMNDTAVETREGRPSAGERTRGTGDFRTIPRTMVSILVGLVVLSAVVACSSGTTAPPTTGTSQNVSGTADFSSSTPLPSDAQLVVKLVDTSDTDTATATLGETTVTAGGKKAPVAFAVGYDVSRIDPTRLYALRAQIESAGKTLFATKTDTFVITQGRPAAGIALALKQP
jgi:uncharacterized lipoprotein YbaY